MRIGGIGIGGDSGQKKLEQNDDGALHLWEDASLDGRKEYIFSVLLRALSSGTC